MATPEGNCIRLKFRASGVDRVVVDLASESWITYETGDGRFKGKFKARALRLQVDLPTTSSRASGRSIGGND